MNRQDRAKQFQPFDALKGLQEELRRREAKMLKESRRLLSEEEAEKLSLRLARLQKGASVEVEFFADGHYLTEKGQVESVNCTFGYFFLGSRQIFFCDVYRLRFCEG